jgi:hypothetical protein
LHDGLACARRRVSRAAITVPGWSTLT